MTENDAYGGAFGHYGRMYYFLSGFLVGIFFTIAVLLLLELVMPVTGGPPI
ncbi:hypothetical protein [Halolamina salifodinae]|uniref:Uncharacterized protein n=1 Tax=Halolamina salifodinae TaxID=1202767 RepID=A0A8T4GYC7_9EURY|nr:hypothetical protein [Halolamina salifodinae]MBP1987232.1 hypothetical protein [Halolamina salifodinae]